MSILRRIEKSLDQRLRSIFAGGHDEPGAREGVELYRDALDQIAGRAAVGKRGDRIFPFTLITIELRVESAERKAVLETLFDPGQLGEDVRATLREERVTPSGELTISVRFLDTAELEMRVLCERNEKPATPAGAPSGPVTPARLLTVTGASSAADFPLDQPRLNLGREEHVLDAAGRAIRRNELYFPEALHDANSTVSRSHAHIRFDSTTGQWRIYDDGSSIGTTLFRAGQRIDVPPHASRGVALLPGDDIYLGQVRLKFEAVIS